MMFRQIRINNTDMYCRYLDAQLFLPLTSGNIAKGRFGDYLKNTLGITRLPYRISLGDLIRAKVVEPDLFIRLPRKYFLNYENFPQCPARFVPSLSEKLEIARSHRITLVEVVSGRPFSLTDLLHPYDQGQLKVDFAEKFLSRVPNTLRYKSHPNGHQFVPYEAYFNYWRAYTFVEALDGYENIENFLPPRKGRSVTMARFAEVNKRWGNSYKEIFTRVSFYRTAHAILHSLEEKPTLTYGDIANFLQSVAKTTSDQLEHDMEKLLILFARWQSSYEQGKRGYAEAIELLRQDIYFVLEWLCTLTRNPEIYYFEKWNHGDRMRREWAELKEVIEYEEFTFQQMFEQLVPVYAESLVKGGYLHNVQQGYERLATYDSFWPWMRAFADLHNNLKQTTPVRFRHVRVLDSLLVISIRTEILIRAIFEQTAAVQAPDNLIDVFRDFASPCRMSNDQMILRAVADRNNWRLTNLRNRPSDIFRSIDSLTSISGWSPIMHGIFTTILRFVTARNYFAHHSFKDESLNNQVSELAGKVLASCVESVVYIDSVFH